MAHASKKIKKMKKNILMAIVAIASTLATVNVNAQDSAAVKSNNELRARYMSKPYEAEVKFHSAGQDVDVLTISRVGEDGDSTVYFKLRPYTGLYFTAEVGYSADFSREYAPRHGAAFAGGVGYTRRHWGVEVTLGLNGLGEQKGRYALSVKPYITPLRWGAERNRLDLGAIVGFQQAPAASTSKYGDSLAWGSMELGTMGPRFSVGAFLDYNHRSFMSGHSWGIYASVILYNPTARFSSRAENITTGETLHESSRRFENLHVQVSVGISYRFVTGKEKKNY